MTITIKLKDLLNESLEMNFIADDLFKYIKELLDIYYYKDMYVAVHTL